MEAGEKLKSPLSIARSFLEVTPAEQAGSKGGSLSWTARPWPENKKVEGAAQTKGRTGGSSIGDFTVLHLDLPFQGEIWEGGGDDWKRGTSVAKGKN